MESSRIFVKGLPPSLNHDEFRKHFSTQSAITDVKLIPHRHIGYVGFKTPEDAARAVKYHNKSFIRTSKIGVELAHSIDDEYASRMGREFANRNMREHADVQKSGPKSSKDDGKRKRKREGLAESEREAKLQEFLEVMRPPSKSNIWENQHAESPQKPAIPIPIEVRDRVACAARSGDDHEHSVKKRKKENLSEERDGVRTESPVSVGTSKVEAKTIPSDCGPSQEATKEPLAQASAVSDTDWLRSRTSRLLGLMDDDDVPVKALAEDAPTEKANLSEVPELVKDESISDASVQTDEDFENDGAILKNNTVTNGRLFVRNLTYTITEEDLRKHFEDQDYGTIQEVSPWPFKCDIYLIRFL